MSAISRVNPRLVKYIKIHQDFIKPYASSAVNSRRGSLEHTRLKSPMSNLESKAAFSLHAVRDDMYKENVFSITTPQKLILEEQLRLSTQALRVGTICTEKARNKASFSFARLFEDL